MTLKKIAGSKLYIGGRVPYKSVVTLADFAGQSWTEIKNWTQAGELDITQETLSQTIIDQNITVYAKGIIGFPIMQNVFSPLYTDPGQIAFRAAQQSCKPFAFKIEWGADCGEESTVTISNDQPAVVSWVGHGLIAGTPIVFTTTGALPTGLVAGTTYYVVNPSTDSFSVATTPGGAAIDTSSAGTGTHTASSQPIGETDLLFGYAMYGAKNGGEASAARTINFPIQPITGFLTV